MDKFGLFKVRASVPGVVLGNPSANFQNILQEVKSANEDSVNCIVFPELSICGYTCADLFQQELLLKSTESCIRKLADATKDLEILMAVGAPVMGFGKLYNCAVIIAGGTIVAIIPKSYLPNYNEFYEKRWFKSGKNIKNAEITYGGFKVPFGTDLIISHDGVNIGVEICEDLWVPQPPSGRMAMAGADIILNLSASDDLIGKHEYLVDLISQQSARCRCVYVYSSAGWGESSTDLVFTGKAIIGEDGSIRGGDIKFPISPFHTTKVVDIERLRRDRATFNTFTETEDESRNYRFIFTYSTKITYDYLDQLDINPHPFLPNNDLKRKEHLNIILSLQSFGLMKRLDSINCRKAVVGISGGLDSALALMVTVKAFDMLKLPRIGIIGITMPGMATTGRTKNNSLSLMKALGVSIMEIPIGEAVSLHFQDIGQDPSNYDATYENSQARERTQILMDIANKEGGIVIGTGDMSELALGWCTYNGDQMSMYGVNASVPKTLVKYLLEACCEDYSKEVSETLQDILATPISPELVPSGTDDISQKTEDLVGPYELHDFYLYYFLRYSFSPAKIYAMACRVFKEKYDEETVMKWLKIFIRRFFSQQFKRSCMPDGPKVGSVNLSPRGDWRMPSDASPSLWLSQLEEIEKNNKP